MAEALKVRLVRCPKCENLLPELHHYSVYKCGGCGAFLRAKKKLSVIGGPPKKLEKEKNGEGFEKLESSSERENAAYLDITSSNEKEINGDFHNNRKDRIFKQRNENLKQPFGSFVDQINMSNESCQADYMMNRSKSVYSNKGKISVYPAESLRSKAILGNWDSDAFANRMADNRSRFPSPAYPGKGVKNFNDANGNRFAHLEQDRVELLRKLDELKEQICRSDSVKHVERRTDFKQFGEGMEMKNSYFPQPCASAFPRVQQARSRSYSRGEYIDYNQEQFVSYSRISIHHRPACPCIGCCNMTNNQHDPYEAPAAVFGEKRSITNRPALPWKDAKSGPKRPSDLRGKAAIGYQKVHPITGGSPFITCYSCFEVLKLPKLRTKNQHKIKCGACSTVLSLESKSKKLIISISIANTSKEDPLRPPDGRVCTEETKCSVDFDSADYEFQSIDSACQMQNVSKSETKKQETATQSRVSSEDDEESNIVQSDFPCVSGMPTKDNAASYDLEENRNESSTADGVVHMNSSEKNLEKNVSSETEIECSSNECVASDLSQDSMDVSKKDQKKPGVFVNGQPIPDHIVKKVEKLAGSIQPGDYWYDFQAGFWGVMGHPCLGIIPPFIEEFSYPMTRNCAAGNTNVFVNGRELHEKDLKLLESRGLPTTEDKFYIIEISGRVFDKDSVKELCSLGKLAPTVVKMGRGFGMKVPRKLLTNEILV